MAVACALACGRDFSLPASGPPGVTGVEPAAGFAFQTVHVTGASLFGPGGERPEVWFGPVQGIVADTSAATDLRVEVPAGARDGAVLVRHSLGEGRSPQPFHFRGGGEVAFGQTAGVFAVPASFVRVAFSPVPGPMAIVRADRTGVFLDAAATRSQALYALDVAFSADGRVLLAKPGRQIDRFRVGPQGYLEGSTDIQLFGRPERVAAAADALAACVALSGPERMAFLDVDAGTAYAFVALPERALDLAASPDGATCYAALAGARSVVAVTESGAPQGVLGPLQSAPSGLALAGRFLLVAEARGVLHRVDLAGGETVSTLLPGAARGLAAAADGQAAFVALGDVGLVARVQVEPLALLGTFAAGPSPSAVAVPPGGGAVVVADDQDGLVRWLDSELGAPLRSTTTAAANPQTIAADPESGQVYLGGEGQMGVFLFDAPRAAFRAGPAVIWCPGGASLSTSQKGGWVAATAFSSQRGYLCLSRPGLWSADGTVLLNWTSRMGGTALSSERERAYASLTAMNQVLSIPLSVFKNFTGDYPPAREWNFRLGPDVNQPDLLALPEKEDFLVVAERDPPALVTIDLARQTIAGRVPLPRPAEQLVVLPDGSAAFVMAFLTPGLGLWRVTLPGGPAVRSEVPFPEFARGYALSVSRNGRILYVGGLGEGDKPGYLGMVDTARDRLAMQLGLPGPVRGLASDGTGEVVFAAVEGRNGTGGRLVLVR